MGVLIISNIAVFSHSDNSAEIQNLMALPRLLACVSCVNYAKSASASSWGYGIAGLIFGPLATLFASSLRESSGEVVAGLPPILNPRPGETSTDRDRC